MAQPQFQQGGVQEDSTEGSEVEEEDLAMEEDKVVNQSSATPVGYLGISRGIDLIHSANTVHRAIIMLKASLSWLQNGR